MKRMFVSPLVFALSSRSLSAQVSNNTSLVGTVTDAAGSVVADAHVIGVNRDTKVAYPGTTNAQGYYSIPYVLPGIYDITVEHAGFSKVVSTGAIVVLNTATRTDATLVVGATTSEVTVTANTPALSTDDAMLGETISAKQIQNLPMNTRRVLELAATQSNITVGPKTGYTGNPPGANFIGAGQREQTNSLTLDGITIMNSLISNSPVTPNPDAVAAVQTQVGNFTAQYGAYSGVHINVDTRSGTNQLHGTAYDYVQNDAFNARAWNGLSTARVPVLRFNQFGGVLSGPVVLPHLYDGRDKLFFTGAYEGMRQSNQSTVLTTLITDPMRNGDFSALPKQLYNPATGAPYVNNQVTNISPISSALLQQYYPHPNLPGITNNEDIAINNIFNKDQTLDRVDYHLGDKVRLFGRYIYEKSNIVNGGVLASGFTAIPTTDQNGAIGYTHIITSRFINDFRFGFNKISTNQLNYFDLNGIKDAGTSLGIPGFSADTVNNNPGIPTFNVSSYQGFGAEGTNWFLDDRTLHGYDQVSYTLGKHEIMAGADIRRMTIGRAAQNQNRGQFTFSGIYSKDGAADFLTGYASNVVTPVFQVKGAIAEWRDGFFVQDNWQFSHKLTLLYGFRYELPTVPYSLNGYGRIINQSYTALIPASTATSGATFVPDPGFKFNGPNHGLYGPRFGFAYRATDKIVVRGGAGIYYNPNQLNNYTLTAGNYPLANSFTYSGNTAPIANTGIILGNLTYTNPTGTGAPSTSCVPGTLGCYSSVFNINHSLPTPRLYQWNLDTGLELWKNAGLEIQYLGSRSIHLDHGYYPNQPLPGPGSVNPRRPNQLFGQIRQVQDDGFETYNGMNVIFRQRTYHGLDANVSYTWAHNLDVSNDTNGGGGTPMIQYNVKADYGNSNWDIRHRMVAAVSYALPELTQFGPVTRSLVGGWHANTIFTLQSGMPINITISDDQANVGGIGSQRPNFVHPGSTHCSRSNYTGFTNLNRPSCIDASAYSLPAPYTFGNLHRNDLYGPGQIDTNFSMSKDFRLFENIQAQLRGEAFNLFNHPNAANPGSTLPTNTNGAFVVTPTTSSFGQITSSQTASRVLQLAGKINF